MAECETEYKLGGHVRDGFTLNACASRDPDEPKAAGCSSAVSEGQVRATRDRVRDCVGVRARSRGLSSPIGRDACGDVRLADLSRL